MKFPELALLDAVKNNIELDLSKTVLVCAQHILESTGSLFASLKEIGLDYTHIFLIGKLYSTNGQVSTELQKRGITILESELVQKDWTSFVTHFNHKVYGLWQKVVDFLEQNRHINRVIILDDGGRLTQATPESILEDSRFQVLAIEQTTKGTMDISPKVPVISVARSACKKYIESPLIADVVVEKLFKKIEYEKIYRHSCGVIGYGSIGRSLYSKLVREGYDVYFYDKTMEYSTCGSLEDLLSKCDFVFGCTGTDIFKNKTNLVSNIKKHKHFISCSSEDIEFLSLIQNFKTNNNKEFNPLHDLIIKTDDCSVTIVNGGFPVNFDNSLFSVPNKYIQITRSLLLLAIIQATHYVENRIKLPITFIMLSPKKQFFIVNKWNQMVNMTRYDNLEWLKEHSEGVFVDELSF